MTMGTRPRSATVSGSWRPGRCRRQSGGGSWTSWSGPGDPAGVHGPCRRQHRGQRGPVHPRAGRVGPAVRGDRGRHRGHREGRPPRRSRQEGGHRAGPASRATDHGRGRGPGEEAHPDGGQAHQERQGRPAGRHRRCGAVRGHLERGRGVPVLQPDDPGGVPGLRRREDPGVQEVRGGTVSQQAVARPRLQQRYRDEIVPRLQEELGFDNPMRVPRLEKIVINTGVGEAAREAKALDGALEDLMTITGQRPVVTRAKKSIASFKLREGMAIGAKVTLRGARMWEFLDRLLATALPRIRDFRGLDPRSFDGRGNYTFGLTEQLVFPEIDYDKVDAVRGMDITIVTTATTDDEGRALLRALGVPLRDLPQGEAAEGAA